MLKNTVTHRPIDSQSPEHIRGQQYSSGVFCGPRSDRCYAKRDKRCQQYKNAVFSAVVRA
jgi:hypothetical protein